MSNFAKTEVHLGDLTPDATPQPLRGNHLRTSQMNQTTESPTWPES